MCFCVFLRSTIASGPSSGVLDGILNWSTAGSFDRDPRGHDMVSHFFFLSALAFYYGHIAKQFSAPHASGAVVQSVFTGLVLLLVPRLRTRKEC